MCDTVPCQYQMGGRNRNSSCEPVEKGKSRSSHHSARRLRLSLLHHVPYRSPTFAMVTREPCRGPGSQPNHGASRCCNQRAPCVESDVGNFELEVPSFLERTIK